MLSISIFEDSTEVRTYCVRHRWHSLCRLLFLEPLGRPPTTTTASHLCCDHKNSTDRTSSPGRIQDLADSDHNKENLSRRFTHSTSVWVSLSTAPGGKDSCRNTQVRLTMFVPIRLLIYIRLNCYRERKNVLNAQAKFKTERHKTAPY